MTRRKRNCGELGKLCPLCGCDVFGTDSCDHLVTVLCNDSDGCHAVAPLFFGKGLFDSQFDCLFELVLEFATRWAADDGRQRTETMALVNDTAPEVRDLIRAAIDAMGAPVAEQERDWYSSHVAWVRGVCFDRLGGYFTGLFDELYRAHPSALRPEAWRTDQPGLSWSGTTYWARDARRCERDIAERVARITDGLRHLIFLDILQRITTPHP